MFYAHIVLAKKGPFARIWLAAHWDKKLTKAQVFETNIEQSVEGIMQPKVKLALRTSGHLLLGVVRIYSRKAKYLLADCNEAFVKIKMAFRPGIVDLPEEHREAAVNAITLPEVFHDFDTALPELNDVDIEAQFSMNQSRADEITMREEYGSLPMSIHDEGFGEMGFDADESDFIRESTTMDEHLLTEEMEQEGIETSDKELPGPSRSILDSLDHTDLPETDGFGDGFGQPAAGLFEGDLFAETPLDPPSPRPAEDLAARDSDADMDVEWEGAAPSSPASSRASRPPSVLPPSEAVVAPQEVAPTGDLPHGETEAAPEKGDEMREDMGEQTTLLNNEEESFALAPVDASAFKGVTKAKRKRKLIVDEVKNISGEEMKSQLANTSDIVTTLDLAPPTKRLMYWKDTGGVEKVFALCARDIKATVLFKNTQRNFISRGKGIEDFSILGPADALALEYQQEQQEAHPTPSKRGRKRKIQLIEPEPIPEPEIHQDPDEFLPPPPPQPEPGQQTPMPYTPQYPELDGSIPLGMASLPSVPMTPGALADGGITPLTSDVSFTPLSLGMTPAGLDHGGMTPNHGIEHLDSIPQLPADQVSSILNGTGMDAFANMGYDDIPHDSRSIPDRVPVDYTDDYDFPPSVGPALPGDEQMENETDEQFEERVLNKRAAQMFIAVKARLQKNESIYLSEMTGRSMRKQAAQKFYSLLVLKKFQALEITQTDPYADIYITKGVMFDNPKL